MPRHNKNNSHNGGSSNNTPSTTTRPRRMLGFGRTAGKSAQKNYEDGDNNTENNPNQRKPNPIRQTKKEGKKNTTISTSSTTTTQTTLSSNFMDQQQEEIISCLIRPNQNKLELLLQQNPTAATQMRYPAPPDETTKNGSKTNTQETLLSLALLYQAPLELIQMIYHANQAALTWGNAHGMSPCHQAATVATPLDVWKFLVQQLEEQQQQQSQQRRSSVLAQLTAPGNWTVLHIACRCWKLPLPSMEYVIRQTKLCLAERTVDKGSTPLHLAILHLLLSSSSSSSSSSQQRKSVLPSTSEQCLLIQQLVQCYPYAVVLRNHAGKTPLDLINSFPQPPQAVLDTTPVHHSVISKDIITFLLDVQTIIRRKFSTRVQVEQAIQQCEARLNGTMGAAWVADVSRSKKNSQNNDNNNNSGGSSSQQENTTESESSTSSTTDEDEPQPKESEKKEIKSPTEPPSTKKHLHRRKQRSSMDEKVTLQQALLAHIEMQLLVPLRKKFRTAAELQSEIEGKTLERQRLLQQGPQYFSQTITLNDQLIALEKQYQREQDALIPQEIQATRNALFARLAQTTNHTTTTSNSNTNNGQKHQQEQQRLRPINDVSLKFLEECTNHFSLHHRIGRGGFGCVYRAYDPMTCAQYAVKKTEKYDDPSLLREVEVLAEVYHPNIIALLGFYVPPDGKAPEYLVYEYASGGTLADRVSTHDERKTLTWSIRLSAAVGVASGLNYLHNGNAQRKIFHHDVKPENIVFSETLDRAILIDCGISKVLKGSQVACYKQTMAGTPFYLPDDYTEDTPYDEKCEVFSFGMVLRVLISGKMPKSLNDRSNTIQPDPLAGNWPALVTDKFMKHTSACVSKKADDRPTLEQIYKNLIQLENEADKAVELTVEQEETVNKTLYQSRQLSRMSRKLEASGKCYCSQFEKKGLFCPGKQHFQCTECFNKYVLDCLGEEIYCHEASCYCREAYTLDELHHHLRRSILCRHIEAMIRNKELSAHKRANERITHEIGKGFERVMTGITCLARNQLQCPLLALLIPARSDRKRSTMHRAMRAWKTSTTKTFFLHFLCAHDRSLVPAPIRVDATRDWVKRAAPFLRAALIGLSVAVIATGLPISIPMLGAVQGGGDSLTENLEVLDLMLLDVAGNEPHMERDMQQLLQAMNSGGGGNGDKLSATSYRMIAELANQPGNMEWKEKMVLAEKRGELAWVRKENEYKWKHS